MEVAAKRSRTDTTARTSIASYLMNRKGNGKSNVTETLNDLVGGMGRPCRLVRGPNSRQREVILE